MNVLVSILALVWLFLFGGIGLFLGNRNLKKREKDASIARYFPFEFLSLKENPLSFALFYLSFFSAFAPLSYLLCAVDIFSSSLRAYMSFGLFSLSLLLVTEILLVLITPSNEKPHFALYLVASLLSSLAYVMEGLSFLALRDLFSFSEALIVMAVLFFTLGILSLLPLTNPRLKRWYELEVSSNPDGTVSYHRPKVFPLALSEWILLFLFALSSVFGNVALLFF